MIMTSDNMMFEKPEEDFCIAEDGVVESFVTWDLGFSSQETLEREKLSI